MNGPSVVSVWPFSTRTVVAVSAGCSWGLDRTPGASASARYSPKISPCSSSARLWKRLQESPPEWIRSMYFISLLLETRLSSFRGRGVEPLLERRAGQGGSRAWEQRARLVKVAIRVGRISHRLNPDRVASPSGEQPRDVDKAFLPRAGNFRDRGSRSRLRSVGQREIGEALGDHPCGDELRPHRQHVADLAVSPPVDDRLHEFVELRGAQDADGDRARQHRLFMGPFCGEVARSEAVDADDRDDDDPLDAGLLADLVQVPGGGREKLRRRLLLGRGPARRVDHGLHPDQRLRQPLAGHDVDAEGARDPDDVVSTFLEHVDDMAADSPSRTRDCDFSACVHPCAPSRGLRFLDDEREALEGTFRPRRASSVKRTSAPAGLPLTLPVSRRAACPLASTLPSPNTRRRASRRECARARLHGERGRGQARETADRRAPVCAPLALAGRAAARTGAECVPEDALLGGVRRLASRPYRGRARGDEGALCVCLRRLPPSAPNGADRLPLPCRGVAAQGDRTSSTRAPAVPGPKDRLTTRRRRAPRVCTCKSMLSETRTPILAPFSQVEAV